MRVMWKFISCELDRVLAQFEPSAGKLSKMGHLQISQNTTYSIFRSPAFGLDWLQSRFTQIEMSRGRGYNSILAQTVIDFKWLLFVILPFLVSLSVCLTTFCGIHSDLSFSPFPPNEKWTQERVLWLTCSYAGDNCRINQWSVGECRCSRETRSGWKDEKEEEVGGSLTCF